MLQLKPLDQLTHATHIIDPPARRPAMLPPLLRKGLHCALFLAFFGYVFYYLLYIRPHGDSSALRGQWQPAGNS